MDYLSTRSDEIGHVLSKRGTSPVFKYFASEQPLSENDLTRVEKNHIEVVYKAQTFFNLLQNETKDNFYYYASGGLEMLNLTDVLQVEALDAMTFPSHLKAFPGPGQVNFWLGKGGVTAYTHYDTSYNLHQVVRGRKRFILFPPEAHSKLKLYPCLHQWYRQVHQDVPKLDREQRLVEFLRELGGFDVELVDGGVLYIPPYWFHCVFTMETTFSLNIWSQSNAYLIMETVYRTPIPFEAHWGKVKLMRTLQHFIRVLIRESFAGSNVVAAKKVNVITEHVLKRYEAATEGRPSEKLQKKMEKIVSEYCLSGDISQILEVDELDHLESRAREIAAMFLGIGSLSVRDISMGNYIEHLAWRMLGTEDLLKLPVYLHKCFIENVT